MSETNEALTPEFWVRDHGDVLYRYALNKTSDPTLAEDLVQETLLAGYRSRKRFANRSSLRTWLIGILKHKIVDHIRKDCREAYLEDHPSYESGTDLAFDRKGHWRTQPSDWQTNPVRALETSELHTLIQDAVQQLTPRLKDVFIRRDLEGQSADEICADLNLSHSNFWVSLHRARQKLQDILEPSLQ